MVLLLWSFNLSFLVSSVMHWLHGSLIVIFQFVLACEFRDALITWFSYCDFQFVLVCEFHDSLIVWFFHCDFSIYPCLWILWYTDHMVLSLWSSICICERILFWNSFYGPFECEYVMLSGFWIDYVISFWCSFNLWLWANLVLNLSHLKLIIGMCYVLNTSGFLNSWCDSLSCAPLSCDCEQILYCNYHIWTRNTNVLRPKHIWILE